jgi:hypothetical protein
LKFWVFFLFNLKIKILTGLGQRREQAQRLVATVAVETRRR